MTDRNHIETVQTMLDEAVAHNANLDDRLIAIRMEMSETGKLKELNNAKIETFRQVLAALSENEAKTVAAEIDAIVAPYSRRMRLGSKKRVVYELIEAGVDTVQRINAYLTDSALDIDSRYIREVVRSGMSEGDFSGDLEGGISITSGGKEIMTKAPLAGDWDEYIEGVKNIRKRLNTAKMLAEFSVNGPATEVAGP